MDVLSLAEINHAEQSRENAIATVFHVNIALFLFKLNMIIKSSRRGFVHCCSHSSLEIGHVSTNDNNAIVYFTKMISRLDRSTYIA